MNRLLPFALLFVASAAQAEPRTVPAFHAIDVAGTIQVEATISPTAHVEVLGDADRLHQVKTDVKNGTLVIETTGDLRKARLKVVVSAPALDALAISGTGTLKVAGLDAPALALRVGGTGDVKLIGKVQKLDLDIGGAGAVNARTLAVGDANIAIGGTGEVSVSVAGALAASITGTGAITVHGKPTSIRRSITGVGVVKTAE